MIVTLKLDLKTREYIQIQKNQKRFDEVILYEALASRNDSIANVVFFVNQENM
jgi:hypothetical protein